MSVLCSMGKPGIFFPILGLIKESEGIVKITIEIPVFRYGKPNLSS